MVIKGDISDDFKVIYLGLLQTKCDFFSSAATVDLQLAQSLARSLYDNWASLLFLVLAVIDSTRQRRIPFDDHWLALGDVTFPTASAGDLSSVLHKLISVVPVTISRHAQTIATILLLENKLSIPM